MSGRKPWPARASSVDQIRKETIFWNGPFRRVEFWKCPCPRMPMAPCSIANAVAAAAAAGATRSVVGGGDSCRGREQSGCRQSNHIYFDRRRRCRGIFGRAGTARRKSVAGGVMYTVILTIHVIICLLVVLIVLMQAGRNSGFSGLMGGGGGDAIFSTSSQQSGLRKATVVLASIFMATSMFLTILSSRRTGQSVFEKQFAPLPALRHRCQRRRKVRRHKHQ